MAFDAPDLRFAATRPLAARNAALDWGFYDVAGLSAEELAMLSAEMSLQDAILVVSPNPERRGTRIERFEGYEGFAAFPGAKVRHFATPGIGASDLGAAALARTLADHVGEPVAALAPGYGMDRLLGEAQGGFLRFGAGDRARRSAQRYVSPTTAKTAVSLAERGRLPLPGLAWDAGVLLRALTEPDRQVATLLGHSRGALAVSFALQAVWLAGRGHFARVEGAQVVTAGAVSPMPEEMAGVRQFLGASDWLGEMNSDPREPRIVVPRAWHHLNTRLPGHLDLSAALAGRLG